MRFAVQAGCFSRPKLLPTTNQPSSSGLVASGVVRRWPGLAAVARRRRGGGGGGGAGGGSGAGVGEEPGRPPHRRGRCTFGRSPWGGTGGRGPPRSVPPSAGVCPPLSRRRENEGAHGASTLTR